MDFICNLDGEAVIALKETEGKDDVDDMQKIQMGNDLSVLV